MNDVSVFPSVLVLVALCTCDQCPPLHTPQAIQHAPTSIALSSHVQPQLLFFLLETTSCPPGHMLLWAMRAKATLRYERGLSIFNSADDGSVQHV
jgi:hypothetical protein